jgi:peptidoglycan/LPS O-acetylase OafA/YrhL
MIARRFALVDALRGIAALAVVLHHAYEGGHIQGLTTLLPRWVAVGLEHASLGVAVFFVLSGFVISHSVYNDQVTWRFAGRFMLRRAIRLDPPYWFAIALAIGFLFLSSRVIGGKSAPDISSGQTIAHMFYLQELLGYKHINTVFWTLCFEVQFYLSYIVLLAASGNKPGAPFQGQATIWALAVAALVSLLWPLGLIAASPWPGSFLPLWYGFLLGAGAYWSWRTPRLLLFFAGYAALLAGAGLAYSNAFTLVCVITAVTLRCATRNGQIYTALNWRWLQFLGVISYSLYLTHNPITGATFRVGYMITGRSVALEALWWVLTVGICVGFASLTWWVIERRSIRWARMIK